MIKINNVDKVFKTTDQTNYALKNINLHINSHKIVGIIGHSGAGKSTLLRLLNGLELPTHGTVDVLNQPIHLGKATDLKSLRKNVSMIFQHFNLLKTKNVFENIAFPLYLNHVNKTEIKERVNELAAHMGLTDYLSHFPKQLSGGQKQRVGIARALALQPKLLLCDEVTSALDPITTHEILNLLLTVHQQHQIGIVLITHEMDVIRKICDDVMVMSNGEIVEQGDVNNVLLHPKHPVSRALILEPFVPDHNHIKSNQLCYIRITAIGKFARCPQYESLAFKANITFSMIHSKIERTKTSLYSQSILCIEGATEHLSVFIELLKQSEAHVEILKNDLKDAA